MSLQAKLMRLGINAEELARLHHEHVEAGLTPSEAAGMMLGAIVGHITQHSLLTPARIGEIVEGAQTVTKQLTRPSGQA